MPRIDVSTVAVRTGTIYPAKFAGAVAGRHKQALGDAGGLTQFGVNLTRLKPGASTALLHWHENEDEFVYVLEGEPTLVEGEAETVLKPGDAATFKAGVAVGHRLVNRTPGDVLVLEVGTRASSERAHYPDDDLSFERVNGVNRLTARDGKPY
jgi:uncharacterized cupin superfamily protein